MSLYGAWQLMRLCVRYCSQGGSSRGARDFVGNYLPRFRINNPQIEIIVQEQKGHPCFIATYQNRRTKEVELRNLDGRTIFRHVMTLRNSHGKNLTKTLNRHTTERRSIQGRWTPDLFPLHSSNV